MSTYSLTDADIDALKTVLESDSDSIDEFQRERRKSRDFLARFVRTAKGDAERGARRLRSFEGFEREHVSSDTPFLSILQVRHAIAEGVGTLVGVDGSGKVRPLVAASGAAAIFCAFSSLDYDVVPPKQMILAFFYMFERLMRMEGASVGMFFLAEAEGLGWKQFNLEVERIFSQFLSDTMPVRLDSLVMVHEPFIIKMMMAMMRPFMSQKVKDRMRFLGDDVGQLAELMGDDNLLERYGGSLRAATGPETTWHLLQDEMERMTLTVSAEAAGVAFARDPTLADALVCTEPAGPFLLDDVVLAVDDEPITAETTIDISSVSTVTVGRVMVDVLGRRREE